MDSSRRNFLLKVARGAAYAVPVIASMSAPEALLGQPTPSEKMGGMSKGIGNNPDLNASGLEFQTGSGAAEAPWSKPPGGGTKAPWSTSPGTSAVKPPDKR